MRILQLWPTEVRVKTGVLIGWKSTFLLVVLFCRLCSIQAQNVCLNPVAKGGFTLSKTTVCVGSPVTIATVALNVSNDQYNFSYDGLSSIDKVILKSDKSFTYSKPGSYTILQAGSGGGLSTGTIACQVVTVVPLDPVKFTAQACLGRRATITVDASTLGQYDTYIIRWGDGSVDEKSRADMQANPAHTYGNTTTSSPVIMVEGIYGTIASPICSSTLWGESVKLLAAATQPIITALTTTSDNSIEIKYQTSAGVSVVLYQKVGGTYKATGQKGTSAGTFTVNTDAKQVQCFQVIAQDACNSATTKSEEVCSLVLDVKAANKQNNLSWQPYAGTISATSQFRLYRIIRNSSPVGTVNNQSTGTYSDISKIDCGTQYCYNLEATVGPTTITSAKACVNGINGDTPGDVGSVIVSVEDGHPRLITTPPPTIGSTDSFTMIVSRASGPSGSFQTVATLERKSTFTDENANASAGSYCYQVTYQNSCGLLSKPSTPVCTVFLEAKSSTGIDWNADSPFTPELIDNYTLEVIDSLNGTKREISIGANTHYEPDPNDPNLQSQKYRIITVSSGGAISYSNFFIFRREARILVPDAFTPNGDGMNDEFLARGIYVDQFMMNIYNRWGEVVYNTTSKTQGWDGNNNGQAAPAGQYMYRIEVIDLTGLKTVRTGALLLVR